MECQEGIYPLEPRIVLEEENPVWIVLEEENPASPQLFLAWKQEGREGEEINHCSFKEAFKAFSSTHPSS